MGWGGGGLCRSHGFMVSGYQGFRVPGFQGFRVYISTSLTFLPCFAMPGGGAVRVTLMSLILLLLLLRRAFRVLGKPCAGHATRHINQNYLGNKLVIPPHTQHTELSLRSLLQVGVSKSAPLPHVVIPPTHSGPASSRLSTPTTCCHPPHTQAQHPAGSAPLPHVTRLDSSSCPITTPATSHIPHYPITRPHHTTPATAHTRSSHTSGERRTMTTCTDYSKHSQL